MNSGLKTIQKALQKYVGCSGMDPKYCDGFGELMDRAQVWCLDIKELYNKAEVHSINTSKGDASDVGVFLDNSQVTVLSSSNLLNWLIWDGGIVCRKLIVYTTNFCLMRLSFI